LGLPGFAEGERRAREGRASSVQKYHLPSASSVVSAVKGLLEKDFITQTNNTYYVYDRFFQLWLEKKWNNSI